MILLYRTFTGATRDDDAPATLLVQIEIRTPPQLYEREQQHEAKNPSLLDTSTSIAYLTNGVTRFQDLDGTDKGVPRTIDDWVVH